MSFEQRIAAMQATEMQRKAANRERWPDFAATVDAFTALFGKPAGLVLPDGSRWGRIPEGRAVQASVLPKPIEKKGKR